MFAVRFDTQLQLDHDAPRPEPCADEAIIRVLRAGICSTDLELCKGYMEYSGILGHEFVGIVEQTDGGTGLEGCRVVGEINAACHQCETCRAGRPTHCHHRTVLGIQGRDGTFAEFVRLPARNLYPLSRTLSDDQAVFIEPLAAACEIPQQVDIHPADRIVVIGDGKLGLLCAQVLRLTGCSVSLLGHHTERNTWLRKLGIAITSHPRDIPCGADIVVEATGTHEGFALASDCVRPRGIIVLKSTYQGTLTLNMAKIVIDEISLVGSRCGPFGPAIRLLEQGLIQVEPMIHAHYPLHNGLAAFEHAATPGVLKVILRMDY
ncbi:MAG: alcohol dehydrogenase catalytic domain-containing protein [Nitrospirales bacterium]|nr:alcohol dehydrogenase catalytic domain-containing protein [Nitrospirales bacterium]